MNKKRAIRESPLRVVLYFVVGATSVARLCFAVIVCFGPSRTPVPTRNTELCRDRPSRTVHFVSKQLSYFVGSRRPLQNCGSQSERCARADCLCVALEFLFVIFVREFLKGVWGKLLARSFPHVIRGLIQRNDRFLL